MTHRLIKGAAGLAALGLATAALAGCTADSQDDPDKPTEITMLVDASDAKVPLFDTTAIHAQEAALESCRGDT